MQIEIHYHKLASCLAKAQETIVQDPRIILWVNPTMTSIVQMLHQTNVNEFNFF